MVRIAPVMVLVAVLTAYILTSGWAEAEDYCFSTDLEEIWVGIGTDGTCSLKYHLEFTNYGSNFRYVDIGMPNSHYALSGARSEESIFDDDGALVSRREPPVERSDYVDPGVQVEVDAGSEPRVVLELSITVDRMVWKSPKNSSMVSVVFRPTWYSSDHQIGNTWSLIVHMTLPHDVPELARTAYHNVEWEGVNQTSQGIMLTWDFGSVSPSSISSGMCDVGIAFPMEYVDKYYEETFMDQVAGLLGSLCALLYSLSPFILGAALVAGAIVLATRQKKDYFRPSISIGGGPRTGLTAPEAAMVLEYPLEQVLSIALYGMVKKAAIVPDPGRKACFVKVDPGTLEHEYERDLYEAIAETGELDRPLLNKALEKMIKRTEGKLRGFSQTKTRQHYKTIVEKAWAEVGSTTDPSAMDGVLRRNDEWLMVDRDFDRRSNLCIMPVMMPNPHHERAAPGGGGDWRPGSFSRSYVGQVQTLSKDVATRTRGITQSMTSILHPTSQGSGSGIGGGGFGGGGSACACACACACAGGGR